MVEKNPLELLEAKVREKFPKAEVLLTRPYRAYGFWDLDIEQGGRSVNVSWSEGGSLVVCDSANVGDANFGGKPDASYADYEGIEPAFVAVIRILNPSVV